MFFRITDVNAFKTALKNYQPTSSTDTLKFVYEIASRKKQAGPGVKIARIPNAQHQIAFTRMGLNFLGQREATGDYRFDRFAMRDDRERLGDQADWDKEFNKPNPDPINGSVNNDVGALHGVFSVAGSGEPARRHYGSIDQSAARRQDVRCRLRHDQENIRLLYRRGQHSRRQSTSGRPGGPRALRIRGRYFTASTPVCSRISQ